MFGYVVVNKQELKFKEYDIYQSYYCGLCQTLKDKYGISGQISLNFDMTFLALLLSSLYEPDSQIVNNRCFLHPIKKRQKCFNVYVDYSAMMTILLSYYKCDDDWRDDKAINKLAYAKLLKKGFNKIKEQYPYKVEVMEKELKQIHIYENNGEATIDELAGCFGRIFGNIFVAKGDEWQDILYEMGFYLGKFIYIMDAYDDIERDVKKHTFNPLINYMNNDDFDDKSYELLEMMISKATLAFEILPIIENAEILRNILYSGVWSRYNLRRNKRMEDKN
ncbi:MAG: DUF5685 family protein [Erysipelotrichaceae bacterium]|nr:DUF5685 family protein [Erysipelotrichaceae bacterium]